MRAVFRPSGRYWIDASAARSARAPQEDSASSASANVASPPCACGGGCPRCKAAAAAPLAVDRSDGAAERDANRAAAIALRGGNTAVRARRVSADAVSPAPAAVHETLAEAGTPLPAALRSEYAARMGHDFSAVRVHTGARARHSASAMNADAYTVGSRIAFADGRYAPETAAGRDLIGHELAHVVQQSAGPPRVQKRGPKDKDLKALEKRVGETIDSLRQGMEKAEQDDYVRSIVFDHVLSKNLVDFTYVRKPQDEKYKDSSLSTETYYIAVEQRPDGKRATKPWMVIVDRRVRFDLHGKHKGRYHIRQSAQLQNDYAKPPAPAKLIDAQAVETGQPITTVVFDKPEIYSTSVYGSEKPAPTLAKRSDGNALFDFGATTKQKIQTLEKLIPGHVPLVPDPVGDRTVKAPRKPPAPAPKPKQEDAIVDVPAPTPTPTKTPTDVVRQSADKRQGGDQETEVVSETPKKDEDHWWDGLLRALGSLLKGLGIFVVAVAAVVAVVFLATGTVIALPVAAAIAGAFLLGWGIGTALRQRFGQKEYEGRPLAAIGRALADAVGITGIQEAITGKDAATGRKLTEGEQTERGILGGVNLLTLLWGGLKGGRGKASGPGRTTTIEPAPTSPKPAPVPVEPTPAPAPTKPVPTEPVPVPAPKEPAPAPQDHAPTPAAPTPVPKDPVPAPKEPIPAPQAPAPAPVEPTPTPVPKDPAPLPKAPEPAPQAPTPKEPAPQEPAPQNAKPRGGARARIEDAQQGLRDAIERLKQKIADESKENGALAKTRGEALSEMQKHKEDALRMGSKHPDYRSTLDKFKKAKERFEELDGQYQAQSQRIRDWAARKAELLKVLNDKTYERPTSYNAGVEDAVWQAASKEGNGMVKGPSGVEIKPGDPWVMGHRPGFEFWKHQVSAARRGLTREQFLREHNNPRNYRPETPAENSSHAYEASDNVSKWP